MVRSKRACPARPPALTGAPVSLEHEIFLTRTTRLRGREGRPASPAPVRQMHTFRLKYFNGRGLDRGLGRSFGRRRVGDERRMAIIIEVSTSAGQSYAVSVHGAKFQKGIPPPFKSFCRTMRARKYPCAATTVSSCKRHEISTAKHISLNERKERYDAERRERVVSPDATSGVKENDGYTTMQSDRISIAYARVVDIFDVRRYIQTAERREHHARAVGTIRRHYLLRHRRRHRSAFDSSDEHQNGRQMIIRYRRASSLATRSLCVKPSFQVRNVEVSEEAGQKHHPPHPEGGGHRHRHRGAEARHRPLDMRVEELQSAPETAATRYYSFPVRAFTTSRTFLEPDAQEMYCSVLRDIICVVSMSDELRRALYAGASVDMELSPPDLIGISEILTMEHREKLSGVLPARAQGYTWQLTFSTSQHGFSLASMYRKMQRVDSPVLLVIQDTDNNVFGALTSCALHPSEHFYGTGESLLFSFQRVREEHAGDPPRRTSHPAPPPPTAHAPPPGDESKTAHHEKDKDKDLHKQDEKTEEPPVKTKFKYWGWTGDNMYFIRGSNDNISIGAGDGKFGLWLDGDLYLGRTQRCNTYGNEPLTTREDFIVKIMECWTFT
ncbi:Oxidation resistance protein 1 [Eumeta japonica]|uniref:Oxidation resistance protein 1 n=1 Tax=Eumeta variegata TaxID=151549 RepID=A0A4C1W8A6_EUMVA|nr:Oxidation resistance protein 1 [Eumeta japonica]